MESKGWARAMGDLGVALVQGWSTIRLGLGLVLE